MCTNNNYTFSCTYNASIININHKVHLHAHAHTHTHTHTHTHILSLCFSRSNTYCHYSSHLHKHTITTYYIPCAYNTSILLTFNHKVHPRCMPAHTCTNTIIYHLESKRKCQFTSEKTKRSDKGKVVLSLVLHSM